MKNRTKIILGILVVVVLVGGFWVFSYAQNENISACVSRSGKITLVGENFRKQECRRNETQITFGGVGEKGEKGDQGPMGPAGPQGETGPTGATGSSPHLQDANGQDLGTMIDIQPGVTTLFTTHLSGLNLFSQIKVVVNSRLAFLDSTGGIYFTGKDCTGTPLMYESAGLNPYMILKASPDYYRYFKWSGNRTSNVEGLSSINFEESCNNHAFAIATAYVLEEITLPFTEPLAWPLEIK